ncbi:general odorant-binding protein 99a-like [Topomyia yanbarensis]|uniref:general odorant-binding protein 99a-like n=1 Tax=Topomyia yanbarensis TaxID=2498891 RepID=UPI00273A7E33|nr:general odorant-binding protein 99a-like [Topomyia yanbarensis]
MQIELLLLAAAATGLFATAAADWRIQTVDDLLRNRNKCIKILDLEDGLSEDFGLFDFVDQDQAKCVVKCIMNRMGLFNDKRGPHVARLVRQMKFASVSSAKDIRNEIMNCVYKDMEMNPAEGCERAYALYQCIQSSNLLLLSPTESKT